MNNIELLPKEIVEIKQLAKNTRKEFGVNDEVPIANDMKMLLDKQGILLCEYPFEADSKIDAEIVRFETDYKPLIFIGLNSSLYYDEQIFALAHEIYHFKTKTGKAYNSNEEIEAQRIEKKADRFAAELLLPEDVLRNEVIIEFGVDHVNDDNILRTLRFIARLQNSWWLPFKSIVVRFKEEELIDSEFYQKLFDKFDSRNPENEYYRIQKANDANIARLLNSRTDKLAVSSRVIEAILKNFDEGIIAEDEFVQIMEVFRIDPSDYGYDIGTFDFEEDDESDGEIDED